MCIRDRCCEIAQLRKRLGSKIPVYADVYEVHGVPLGAKPIEDAAWESVHEAFADGLFISGRTAAESIELIRRARTRVPETPIFLGGGATGDNICELMQHFDLSLIHIFARGAWHSPAFAVQGETEYFFLVEQKADLVDQDAQPWIDFAGGETLEIG